MKKSEAIWAKEFEEAKSWKDALLSRLRFQGGMTVGDLANDVEVGVDTALRHVKKVVENGLAYFDNQRSDLASDWHFKPTLQRE
ncbi:MAG: hypothetical protein WC827_00040 [Candidatus Paceibacterota bacterium]